MRKIVDWDNHIGRHLRLRDLHVFFLVVQAGSLGRAAAQLNISQPAISQLIAGLEGSLGVKLFDRGTRGVALTPFGSALLKRSRAAFDELKQGIREIEFLSAPAEGEIKFGCPEGLAPILPPVIESFAKKYPGIVLDIYEEEFATFAAKLRNRSLDFVLQRLHGRPRKDDHANDDLNVEIIFEDELVVVAGTKSPWNKRRRLDLSDLLNEPWILAAPPSWNHKVIAEICQSQGLAMPNVVLSTFSTHIRASMISSGKFIATFPISIARFYAKHRAAMAFGGIKPGDYKTMLLYNKDRVFAFVNALGDVNAEWAAAAAGCVNWGFPTLADTDIPEILPTGICTYEHVVANVKHEDMVQKSVEVRGLKVTVSKIDIPCAFGPAYEGERVRGADLYCQCGGGKTQCTELVKMAEMNEIEDGKVTVVGPDLKDVKAGGTFSLGIYVQIAGREFQTDFEPILERQIHHLINYIQGIMHIGQRDISWVRISKAAMEKGFYPERYRRGASCQIPSGFPEDRGQGSGHPVHEQGRCGQADQPRPRRIQDAR